MHSLTSLHTFGLTAHSKQLISVDNDFSILEYIEGPLWVLGEGSNCIFLDDFDGSVIKIDSKGKTVEEFSDYYQLTVSSGENWHQLVRFCMQNNIFGLENLALIPGSVGAAPIQNIGAYGVELNQFIKEVVCTEISTGEKHILSNEECQFGYRDSVFKRHLAGKVIITQVVLHIPKRWQACNHYGELAKLKQPSPEQIFNQVIAIRKAKLPDPNEIGNAGSFFKNPLVSNKHYASLQCDWPDLPCFPVDHNSVKVPAAWLIDHLGFKGKQLGGIQCHPNQPLVLTNNGQGNGAELLEMARQIQTKVENTFSIHLENEVRLIGKKGLVML
ncbi:UDP-N-acetylmuramate dehydrogenase [Aliiglaciecola sp. SL4]|uniref:UDP-N-acetylmuramate dehydrogenase n=1 Tax=Aliiglaciecola sp. SL4 TaxID=3239806 RepID=UPI00355C44E8